MHLHVLYTCHKAAQALLFDPRACLFGDATMSCLLDLGTWQVFEKELHSTLASNKSVALQALEVHQDTTEAMYQWQFACGSQLQGSHVVVYTNLQQ